MDKSEVLSLLRNAGSSGSSDYINYGREGIVTLPFLDTGRLRVETLYLREMDEDTLADGISNLTQLPPSLKPKVIAEIFRWYNESWREMEFQDAAEAIEAEEFETHIPPENEDDILRLIKFSSISGSIRRSDECPIIAVRGETEWDSEHGISLFFERGKTLIKVDDLNSWV